MIWIHLKGRVAYHTRLKLSSRLDGRPNAIKMIYICSCGIGRSIPHIGILDTESGHILFVWGDNKEMIDDFISDVAVELVSARIE